MPKYKITISQTFSYSREVEIEADNEDKARCLAYKEECDEFNSDNQDYGNGIEIEDVELISTELTEEDLERIELNKIIQNNNFFNKLGVN